MVFIERVMFLNLSQGNRHTEINKHTSFQARSMCSQDLQFRYKFSEKKQLRWLYRDRKRTNNTDFLSFGYCVSNFARD